MQATAQHNWLLYCRPGFERDCVQETQAGQIEAATGSGFAVVYGKPRLVYAQLAFARQLIRLHGEVNNLPERDRLTPLLAALPAEPQQFGALWLEVPDTNEGKLLSSFARRFQPLLEAALIKAGRMKTNSPAGVELAEAKTKLPASNRPSTGSGRTEILPRLHIFFPDQSRALIGSSDPRNGAAWPMGILRQKMPHDAPSRSYLKLAEAFETFLDQEQQKTCLKPGMVAVDLGAAPGGWTWQLARRGLKVIAVDNGPLKGAAAQHPAIKHLRQDGFRYRPSRPVDWVVCDMVEQPQRVAALMADWISSSLADRAIFNLKLPMKKRLEALTGALNGVRAALDAKGIRYRLEAKQLYHDREEVTVFLARVKPSKSSSRHSGEGRNPVD
ncbi:MAG: ribosomal RNA methyltransferase RrmJ/FtsJ [Gallionellaceae bacterium]|nr:MAG: ribosomal RNA methyltransferase RrmJ/FtsJ [Gallionellaceae bacterium]